MIKNLWGIMEVYCGHNHENEVRMEPGIKKGIMSYCCPSCQNYLTMNDFEKALNKIDKELYDAEMNNEMLNLAYTKWTTKGIKFKITEHSDKKIKIEVINKGVCYDAD